MLVEFNSIVEVIGIKLKNIHYVIFSVNEKATVKVALWIYYRFIFYAVPYNNHKDLNNN